ncbi:MAG TPA: DUF4974 domain-containing protein [Bacteroidetes bacterium]|nr:DUF4974 domain-containing protein [Bacteroidota bacterium]
MTNDEILHKWINGELSAEELAVFKNRPEYDSLVELYKNTEDLAAPAYDADDVLSNILKRGKVVQMNKGKIIPLPQKNGRRAFIFNWIKYGVAASLLIIAGWFVFSNMDGEVVYELAKGERQEGILPDQSTFVLNAESRLSFDKKTWKKERSLYLEGEAFFHVTKGSKFTVNTPNGSVQVLGTKFNVWSRNNILEVKCQSGKVAVRTVAGKKIDELTRNDALRISDGKVLEKWETPTADNATWVDGISKFRKVELAVVLEELERQFDIKINTGNIDTKEIISCNFQHGDLDAALKTTVSALGIRYEILDGKRVQLFKLK